jgi:hypothetical protein
VSVIDARSVPAAAGASNAPSRGSDARRTLLLRLAPTSRTLRIETDDERAAAYVRAAYGSVLVAEPALATDRAVLATAPDASHASFDGVVLPRTGAGSGVNPWQSDAYVVDQFVWLAIARDPDWISVYGCAVVVDGRAVLLVGPTRVGKTTLAVALSRLGARVLGDEMILIHRRDRTVDAIDRRLSIRWGADDPLDDPALCERIRAGATTLRTGRAGALAVDRRLFGEVTRRSELAATFIVARGDGGLGVVPTSVNRTALRIASFVGAGAKTLADVADIAGVLAHGRCFSLTLGDPNASARAVVEALRAC